MQDEVTLPLSEVELKAIVTVPERARGVVIFAHGSGSGRTSPRNSYVAEVLQDAGMATVLADLLTPEEDQTYANRFDIALLTERLLEIAEWTMQNASTQSLPIGYFGASTGAAAALEAAAEVKRDVAAVVSRGGRTDLAQHVADVTAPTLLIVGGDDDEVLELNKHTLSQLNSEKALEVVPGATHLFEEPGALEHVAEIASAWFQKKM